MLFRLSAGIVFITEMEVGKKRGNRMKKRTFRNIIQGIIAYILLYTAFEFMSKDYISEYLEMIIFSSLFLFFNWYCFNNGLKTSRELYKEVREELEA